MSEQNKTIEQQPLIEESIYLLTAKDRTVDGKLIIEVAQYRKGKFWFFGWEVPEPTDKFESWKELVLSIKE
jgi:hypothetical protein